MNNAKALLEELARNTWYRLRYSQQLGISQGEETISDLNLLELKMRGISEIVRVEKCPKPLERWRGLDWEWIIGSNRLGWIKYAVQAKKLSLDSKNLSKGRYNTLHEPFNDGSGDTQLEILKSFANARKMVPLYCLYNFIDKQSFLPFWNCSKNVDKEQLGCSVTPLRIVETQIATRGGRSFDGLHMNKETIPWRCLVSSPVILDIYKKNFEKKKSINGLKSRPAKFQNEILGEVFVHNQPLDTLKTAFDSDSASAPKRLLVLDISSTIETVTG